MDPSTSTSNSLGLDFNQLSITNSSKSPENAADKSIHSTEPESKPSNTTTSQDVPPESPSGSPSLSNLAGKEKVVKKKPYVNPERVNTGGNQRDKLSEEALSERMMRMREQNEKIKQRRVDVQADEDAFKKTQEKERAKIAQIRKVQENVDRTREQNAQRKMSKIQSREWDSGKPTTDWKRTARPGPPAAHEVPKDGEVATVDSTSSSRADPAGWTRGGGGSRGGPPRGRGRGRGGMTRGSSHPSVPSETQNEVQLESQPVSATSPTEPTIGEAV